MPQRNSNPRSLGSSDAKHAPPALGLAFTSIIFHPSGIEITRAREKTGLWLLQTLLSMKRKGKR